ncbi:hypothetical protein HYR99_18775 [Candidatus Poribacteria bacterium]|nr:hypothetical protein [Candidatus Poribacteria bacterium]
MRRTNARFVPPRKSATLGTERDSKQLEEPIREGLEIIWCYIADELFPERNLCHFVKVMAPAWRTIDILSKSCNLRYMRLTFRQKRDGAVKTVEPYYLSIELWSTGLTAATRLAKPNSLML